MYIDPYLLLVKFTIAFLCSVVPILFFKKIVIKDKQLPVGWYIAIVVIWTLTSLFLFGFVFKYTGFEISGFAAIVCFFINLYILLSTGKNNRKRINTEDTFTQIIDDAKAKIMSKYESSLPAIIITFIFVLILIIIIFHIPQRIRYSIDQDLGTVRYDILDLSQYRRHEKFSF